MTRSTLLACGLAIVATAQPATPVQPTGSRLLFYDAARERLLLVGATLPAERADLLTLWAWRAPSWSRLPENGPAMRTTTAAAFDTGRGRLVVYGGVGNDTTDRRSDTWEWDGTAWHAMSDRGAGARDHHAMAFDEARGRTMAFGGATAPGSVRPRPLERDTWVWDGARWQLAATSGPSPRSTTMVDDTVRGQVLLFGGVGDAQRRFADTWAWNGRAWRLITDAGPPARNGHAMAFDRAAGVVLLFGGTSGARHFDDLWRWDGQRWSEVRVDGVKPGPRVGAGMAYDATRDRTVLYGGHVRVNGAVRDSTEMWEWDRRAWTRIR
ncbi:MAG TPA: hypothetical protein VFO19_07915 [Vicinamibacterales bacterium]|nr:hypothetical protein [Vicinamibacterales bacterium]